MCVCVCHCLLPPPLTASSRVHSPLIKLVGCHAYMCQDCVRFLSEAPSTLCITRDTVCVCVCVCLCVFDISCFPKLPLCTPDLHSPLIYLVGRSCLHVSRLVPIIARGSIHPVYHGVHCVCVCVCVCDISCSPHPPLRPPEVHSPLI